MKLKNDDCTDNILDLKDMLKKTENLYGDKPAYKLREGNQKYRIITHKEAREMINFLGTALINMGLKNKKIAIIGENRYEWEIAYLAIVCGTGIVVPLDKSLPENELERLIDRSGVEAIFFSSKYEECLKNIVKNSNNLKYLISMDIEVKNGEVYSEKELINIGKELLKNGNNDFIDSKINSEEMNIMLFTSGTTSESKVVALSHKNICSNLMDIASILNMNSNDRTLSFLPLHHVFECTVGFLLPLYKGAQISFCDGIRYVLDNFREYNITFAAFVPAIYENIHKMILKKYEKQNKLDEIKKIMIQAENYTYQEKKKVFKEIHDLFGGSIKILISGAAALDVNVEKDFRTWGINLCQGYGLTETSPVIGIETENYYKIGSIGKPLPHVKAKIENPDNDGIGELVVKGPNVMLGYFQNEYETNRVLKDNWFYTGDLAQIDEEGYIFICGRKKNVIVLKNGKNIFPEEMEKIVNNIQGVKESFIFGKSIKKDKNDVKIYAKIVYDKDAINEMYNTKEVSDIYDILNSKIKEINKTMPLYKGIKGIILTETPLIKTTTSKIKRQEEIKTIV